MIASDLIELIEESFDSDEEVAFYLLGHTALHDMASACGVAADCEIIDEALHLITVMLRHGINMPPNLPLLALSRALALQEVERTEPTEDPVQSLSIH